MSNLEGLSVDDLVASLTRFGIVEAHPLCVSIAVAPDVFATMKRRIPICRGDELVHNGLRVFISSSLPPGTIVPLDADGCPIAKPRPETTTPPTDAALGQRKKGKRR